MSTPRPTKTRPPARANWASMGWVALYDIAAGAFSMWLAVQIRYFFHESDPPSGIIFQSVAVFALACALVFLITGLHRGVWRYTALNDAARIIRAVGIANFVFLPVLFLLNRLDGFPRTSILIEIPILITLLLGARMAATAWRTRRLQSVFRLEDRDKPTAVLVGTEAELDDALRDLSRRTGTTPFRPKGLVVPEGQLTGRAIRGVPVYGDLDALPALLNRLAADEALPPRLVIAGQNTRPELVNALIRIASVTGAKLSRARPAHGPGAFSPVETADLLNRPPRSPDLESARPLIEGRRVLVTGAGGTIGSELVRLAAILKPEKLILVDSSEANLYEIDMELKRLQPLLEWRAVLADIRDETRMDTVFEAERPDVVLHAAALKHVPMSELNPGEAVRTNVLGTSVVMEAAKRHHVKVMALISTDKAVEPGNVMGTTKRAAELLVQSAAKDAHSTTRVCVVRFGNVLGSTGSVVPLFEQQIATGRSVTVTDAEVTRYFMTVAEASGLVLAAAAQTDADPARNGALYVFDMGEPVSIMRLARQLLRLRGIDPDARGAIQVIGLRPGEKLHESLVYPFEQTQASGVDSIWNVAAPPLDETQVQSILDDLLRAARTNDTPGMVSTLDRITHLTPQKDSALSPSAATC